MEIGMGTKGRQDARSSFALGIWKSHKQIAGCADRSHPDQGRLVQKLARFFFGGFALSKCLAGIVMGWAKRQTRSGSSRSYSLFMCNQRVVEYIRAFLWAKRRMIYVPTICLQLVLMMFFSSTHRYRYTDRHSHSYLCYYLFTHVRPSWRICADA